jgi:hypothetical protein
VGPTAGMGTGEYRKQYLARAGNGIPAAQNVAISLELILSFAARFHCLLEVTNCGDENVDPRDGPGAM